MNTTSRCTVVCRWIAAVALTMAATPPVHAQPPGQPQPAAPRRVFVPVEGLDAVLERHRQGVFLQRAEFDELLKLARAAEQSRPRMPSPLP